MVSSRFRGCLYGQAIGDALGLGAEAMTQTEVALNYPAGLVHYSDIVQDYHRSRWRQGDWTDDTDMMLCIADAIIEDNDDESANSGHNSVNNRDNSVDDCDNSINNCHNSVNNCDNSTNNRNNSAIDCVERERRNAGIPENATDSNPSGIKIDYHNIARHFKAWADGTSMGIGLHTRNVLAFGDYTKKPVQASKLLWELNNRQAAANGGVMRTAIVGLLPNDVRKNAEEICRLTHYDPRCVGSCVIVSELIHALVYGGEAPDLLQIKETAKQYDERIIEYIDMAYKSDDIAVLMDDQYAGYTLRTLAVGLWAYWHASSFKDGLLAVVNAGGDADTNAAVACAILGAKFGFDTIPSEYVDGLVRKEQLENVVDKLLHIFVKD